MVDKGLYLPESWTSDKDRCEAAGVPEDRQGYRSKTELALEMVGRAQERGHLKAGWVAADDAFGYVAVLPGGPGGLGDVVRAGRSVRLYGVAAGACLEVRSIRDSGVPANPGCETVSAGPWSSAATSCRRRPGVRLRWPREARGHAATWSFSLSAQRVRPTSRRKPGEIHWAVYRRNRDGSEPRYYLSNAPEDTPWRPWHTWEAPVGV